MLTNIISSISTNENLVFCLSCLSILASSIQCHLKYNTFKTTNPNAIPHSFLEKTIGYIVSGLGGGIILGFILGQGPSWMYSASYTYTALTIWCIVSILFSISSLKSVLTSLSSSRPVVSILLFATTFIDAVCLTEGGVEYALTTPDHKLRNIPVAVFCGIFAAFGGGILGELFNIHGEWKFQRSNVLRQANAVLVIGVVMSILYAVAIADIPDIAERLQNMNAHTFQTIATNTKSGGGNVIDIGPTILQSVDNVFAFIDSFGYSSLKGILPTPSAEQLITSIGNATEKGNNTLSLGIMSTIAAAYRSLFQSYTLFQLRILFMTLFFVPAYLENLGSAGVFTIAKSKTSGVLSKGKGNSKKVATLEDNVEKSENSDSNEKSDKDESTENADDSPDESNEQSLRNRQQQKRKPPMVPSTTTSA